MEFVFFLFPGRVLVVLLCVTGIRTDKEPTGQSPLSILEPSAVILNFFSGCQYFFKGFFLPLAHASKFVTGRIRRGGVAVIGSISKSDEARLLSALRSSTAGDLKPAT